MNISRLWPALRPASGRYLSLAVLILLLQACDGTGVVVNDSSDSSPAANDGANDGGVVNEGGSNGGTASGGTNTAPEDDILVEPENDDEPTGEVPVATSVSNLNPDDVAASRFLAQATFGATDESIEQLRSKTSYSAWIDEQMALPASLTEPYARAAGDTPNPSRPGPRHEIWWNNVLDGPDQLRQRVAFALSQLFVVSDLDYLLANAQFGIANYYDMLSINAFGNYRELLENVTLHPVMGVYLGMVRNEKADPVNNIRPDENFAREVLQLFSIGLYELNNRGEALPENNPVDAYTQAHVEEFARVFTGWNYNNVRSWVDTNLGFEGIFTTPMVPDEAFHDFGAKQLLNDTVVPAGLSTRADLKAALDNIFQHQNVGVFVSRHLIQQLVTSNPSPEYIERMSNVFNDNGSGIRGDLGALVKAILLDTEAREGYLTDPDFGKLREPVIRMAHYWRALNGTPGPLANGVHNTSDFTLQRVDEMTGQAVMNSPSVFNFFKPDNTIVPGGNMRSPEMEIMTEANLASTHNNYHDQIYRFNNRSNLDDDNPRVTIIDLEPLIDMASDADALLDWYNLVLLAGGMPDNMRQTLFEYITAQRTDDAGRLARVQDSLFMVMVSPQFHLQR